MKRICLLVFFAATFFNVAAQKIKVACVGNSVTAGYLLQNPSAQSYPAQLQQLLGDTYEVGNFGLSGATLLKKGHRPYNKTEEFKKAIAFKANIIVIHLGLNDTDPRNWPNYKANFKADYKWLIDTLKQNNADAKVFICRLTPIFSGHPRFKSGTRDWYWQVQKEIEEIAYANKVDLIDLNTPLQSRTDLFGDNLHPDKNGAGIIAKTVYQNLTGNYNGFKLNELFADHMVLQRDQQIPVFGTANANTTVQVTFNNQVKTAKAGANGKWKVFFPAMKFGGPYQMNVKAGNTNVTLNDILIGDVWLCSGQSNMAFQVKQSATANVTLKNINNKLNIRLLKFTPLAETDNVSWNQSILDSINELNYFKGFWSKPTESTVANFSAVAYYFGEKLASNQQVPIGLIQMAVGGSTLESWMDRKTIEHDNLLVDMMDNWRKSDFIQDWARGRADVNIKNATNARQRHPYEPAYNYEAGIAKLIEFPIKGAIWYQGESNAHNVDLFKHEFPVFVKSWRDKWQSNFPFYYVQLSSIDRPSWPDFRETQQNLLTVVPNSGMAVSSDLGDSLDVHPKFKKQIGERLALLALKNNYNQNITATGPKALKATRLANSIQITFDSKALKIANSNSLIGFELVDQAGIRYAAKATIIGNKVNLEVPQSLQVVKVLYAYQAFTRANLVNEANLPASTFSILIK